MFLRRRVLGRIICRRILGRSPLTIVLVTSALSDARRLLAPSAVRESLPYCIPHFQSLLPISVLNNPYIPIFCKLPDLSWVTCAPEHNLPCQKPCKRLQEQSLSCPCLPYRSRPDNRSASRLLRQYYGILQRPDLSRQRVPSLALQSMRQGCTRSRGRAFRSTGGSRREAAKPRIIA